MSTQATLQPLKPRTTFVRPECLMGALLCLVALACGTSSTTSTGKTAPAAAHDGSGALQLALSNAENVTRADVLLIAVPSSESAILSDHSRFVELMGHVRVIKDVAVDHGTLSVNLPEVKLPHEGIVIVDSVGHGVEALFGPKPGLWRGHFAHDGATRQTTVALTASPTPSTSTADACSGPRLKLVTLKDTNTAGVNGTDTRKLCVYLPKSYESEPTKRYGIVYWLPGLSGRHARARDQVLRDVFDAASVTANYEALLVQVGTRTPEGSSYFTDTKRYGAWETFITQRVPKEIESRFRTTNSTALFGHSTGGFNAVSLALRHPDNFGQVLASSPDALNLDTWLLNERGRVKSKWLKWMQLEAALGGRGQFVSYGAAWSPTETGFAWPVNLQSGEIKPDIFQRWRAASPTELLKTDMGKRAKLGMLEKLIITCGRQDEFGLFEPAEAFVRQLQSENIAVTWLPTAFGHGGHTRERFEPPLTTLLARMSNVPLLAPCLPDKQPSRLTR